MYKAIANFFIRYHFLFFFLSLESLALFFIFSKSPLHNLIYKGSANFFIGSVYKMQTEIENFFSLKEINERLILENASLREKIKNFEFAKPSEKKLKISNLKHLQPYTYKPAKVINNSTHLKNNFITLDKGEIDGIKPQMGVVFSNGIGGIIVRTSPHFSTAISLLNTQIRVNVRVKENNYFGFLSWDGKDPRYMILSEIQRHAYAKILEGYLVETDSKSAIFPEGISIGTVQGRFFNQESNNYSIRVRLNFDMDTIKEAYIVENLFKKERKAIEIDNSLL